MTDPVPKTDPKHPLMSMTIWGGLITAVSLFLRGAGIDIPDGLEGDLQNLAHAAIDVIGVAMVIVGRFRASRPIAVKKPPASTAGVFLACLILPLMLSGCGGMLMSPAAQPKTLKERVFATGHEIRAMLNSAAAYVEQPVCVAPRTVGCADPDLKAQIKSIAATLGPELRDALAMAKAEPDPNAPRLALMLQGMGRVLNRLAVVLERAGIQQKEKTSWDRLKSPLLLTASRSSPRPAATIWPPPRAPNRSS